jgi:hypothetical protein
MLRASKTLHPENDTRRLNSMSMHADKGLKPNLLQNELEPSSFYRAQTLACVPLEGPQVRGLGCGPGFRMVHSPAVDSVRRRPRCTPRAAQRTQV